MPRSLANYVWFNGEIMELQRATVNVMAHALHYGSSIFEGIRAYPTPRGAALFRLRSHLERFYDAARIYHMTLPYRAEQLAAACHEVLRANKLEAAYLRPIAFRGLGEITITANNTPIEIAIGVIPWDQDYLPDKAQQGVDVCVSSWARPAPNTLPMMAKMGGYYLSSQLIQLEALRNGYAEGIALDSSGHLSEGSTENLFVIRNGIIMTPPVSASLLPGITRDTIIILAGALGYEVREQAIPREALYVADELFFTGTAAEVSRIRSVDGVMVKGSGQQSIVTQIQKAFFGLFSGESEDRHGWLEYPAGMADTPLGRGNDEYAAEHTF